MENLKVVAYEGTEGAIYAEGAGTDVTVDTAYISLAGDGQGIGGPASGASAKYNAKLTIKNAVIDTNGRTRYATAAEEGSVLKVYDSVICAHGIPYGDDIERPDALMSTPPPALEMDGNTRTHCTMSNSSSYFYNSKSSVTDGLLCPRSLPKDMYTWRQMIVILFVPRAVTVHTPIRDATITSMTVTLICPAWQPLLQEIPI